MDWLYLRYAMSASGLIFFLCWIVAVIKKDNSLVDRFWGLSFAIHALVGFLIKENTQLSHLLMTLAVVIWGSRLSIYISIRNWGHGEDPRYRYLRSKHDPKFYWIRCLVTVFMLQWLLSGIISAPVFWVLSQPYVPLDFFFCLGMLMWCVGFFFEAVGDWQLTQFKKDPSNKGLLMTKGLWSWTRHPNYFGDGFLWLGFGVAAIGSGGWWTIYASLAMNFLLRRVSGVSFLEEGLKKTKPGYEEYMKRTPAYFPCPPKLMKLLRRDLSS